MVAHGLRRSGRRVGLFTSPHLHSLCERIQVDGRPIDEVDLDRYLTTVLQAEADLVGTPGMRLLTFFELLTLAACEAFVAREVDVAVLEAGLGGRYDATRVATSTVTLVTRIGRDHECFLGTGLRAIAREKAAVIHAGAPCFSAPQQPEACLEVEAQAAKTGTSLTWVEPTPRPPVSLPGEHQRVNAALALSAVREFTPEAELEWFDGVSWPGRLERVEFGNGHVLFDVAHNPDGIGSFVQHIRTLPPARRTIVFGCMHDKPAEEMLRSLQTTGLPVWLTACRAKGATPPEELATLVETAPEHVFQRVDERLYRAIADELERGGEVCICGSCYLVGEIRGKLLGFRDDPEFGDPLVRRR